MLDRGTDVKKVGDRINYLNLENYCKGLGDDFMLFLIFTFSHTPFKTLQVTFPWADLLHIITGQVVMALCQCIRGHMLPVSGCRSSTAPPRVIFVWSLASPHAHSANSVSRRNWWLCQLEFLCPVDFSYWLIFWMKIIPLSFFSPSPLSVDFKQVRIL